MQPLMAWRAAWRWGRVPSLLSPPLRPRHLPCPLPTCRVFTSAVESTAAEVVVPLPPPSSSAVDRQSGRRSHASDRWPAKRRSAPSPVWPSTAPTPPSSLAPALPSAPSCAASPPLSAWDVLRSAVVEPLSPPAAPSPSAPPPSPVSPRAPPRHEWRELFVPRRPELWVTTEEQLTALTELLQPHGVLAMDTEFLLFPHYRSELHILQVAAPSLIAAVDCHGLRHSPALTAFVASLLPKQLIVHSAKGDMEVLYDLCTHLGLQPRVPLHVFDTQIAAAYAGYGGMVGYGPLLTAMYGLELNKSQTLTDWSVRPLSAVQLDYCMGDVRHLHCMREDLVRELSDRGRLQWLDEELRCLPNEGLYAPVRPEEAWRHVWSAVKLKDYSDELSVLRELSAFRELTCARLDQTPNLMMRPETMMAIALQLPSTVQQLHNVQGLKASVLRRFSRQLLRAVQRGREAAREAREGLFHRRLNHQQAQRLKGGLFNLLSSRAESVAGHASISSFHLAPRSELMDLAAVSEAAIERVKALPPSAFHPVPMISNFWGVKPELLPFDLSTAPRALYHRTRREDGGGEATEEAGASSPATLTVEDEVEMLCKLKVLSGWRRQMVGDDLLDIASGRDSLTWRDQQTHLTTTHSHSDARLQPAGEAQVDGGGERAAVDAGDDASFDVSPAATAAVSLHRLTELSVGEHSTAEALLTAWATALSDDERRHLSAAALWLYRRLAGADGLHQQSSLGAGEEEGTRSSVSTRPLPQSHLHPHLLEEVRRVVERMAHMSSALRTETTAAVVKRRRG